MKKTLLLAAMLLACSVSNAAAVWDIKVDAIHTPTDNMSLLGTFTTAGDDFSTPQLITSFSGTFTDALNPLGVSFSLVPTTSSIQGSVFNYNNLFYFGPTIDASGHTTGWSLQDSFDNSGVVIKAGSSYVNLYTESSVLFSYDYQNGATYAPTVGDAGFAGDYIKFAGFTTSVPEPMSVAFMLAGLGVIAVKRRQRI